MDARLSHLAAIKQMKLDLAITVDLPVEIKKKGKIYVSFCPSLDVFSQGDTKRQAKRNLIEAIEAFITGCIENGMLDGKVGI